MIDRATIQATLIELLEADTGEKFGHIGEKDNIRDGLGLDSVDVVSVVSQVERKFHIRLTHEELIKVVTVGDLLDLVQGKGKAPGSQAA
jgi:acyl carrier protein